jgi:hypothetical protein
MKKTRFMFVLLAACLMFAACGSKDDNTGGGSNVSNSGSSSSKPAESSSGKTADSSLSDPKGSIAYQFELLKAGDVDKLRACFTERQRPRITKEIVDTAQSEAGRMTLDDLYASAEPGEYEGKKTTKVKMKNGRTLTTLILTDGKWLADTVWFN